MATQPQTEQAEQQLAKREDNKQLGVSGHIGMTPRTFEEGWRFAQMIAMSELAPKEYKGKPMNVLVAIQMGAELGLAPMASLQNIAVINGRPALWGDGALAVVMRSPNYESHREYFEGEGDKRVAVCEIKRKGQDVYITRFSVSDAAKAGLLTKDSPWKTYRDRMLQMRARSWALRDKFADALRGLGIAEEVRDIPQEAEAARPIERPKPIINAEVVETQAAQATESHSQSEAGREEAKTGTPGPDPQSSGTPANGAAAVAAEAGATPGQPTGEDLFGKAKTAVQPSDGPLVEQKDINKLCAVWRSALKKQGFEGDTNPEIHRQLQAKFGYESLKQIPKAQLEAVLEYAGQGLQLQKGK